MRHGNDDPENPGKPAIPRLLQDLNGGAVGTLNEWIDRNCADPRNKRKRRDPLRIAWYPSAGGDLRDLIYLHPDYRDGQNESLGDRLGRENFPELFLHTDVCDLGGLIQRRVGEWFHTVGLEDTAAFRVVSRQELRPLTLRPGSTVVNRSAINGTWFFLVDVESKFVHLKGCPLLYVFAENAAFCAQKLVGVKAAITHLFHHCYGPGTGTEIHSDWLMRQLDRLSVRYLISDEDLDRNNNDNGLVETFRLFPILSKDKWKKEEWPVVLEVGLTWRKRRAEGWVYSPITK